MVLFLTVWGLNTFYFDEPKKPEIKKEINVTKTPQETTKYFETYINK